MNTAKFSRSQVARSANGSTKSSKGKENKHDPAEELTWFKVNVKRRWESISPETRSILRAIFVLCLYYGTVAVMFIPYDDNWTTNDKDTKKLIDAMYFASVTISTVGYGDISPVDQDIQVLVGFLILVAFIFIANEVSLAVEVIRNRVAEHQRHVLLRQLSRRRHAKHPMEAELIALGYKQPEPENHSRLANMSARTKKLVQSLAGLTMNILITHMVFWIFEDYDFKTALYGALATVTTVGYGDVSFTKNGTRIFACFWLLVAPLNTLYCINGIVAVMTNTVPDPDQPGDGSGSEGGSQAGGSSANLNNLNATSGGEQPQSEVDFILDRWIRSDLTEKQMLSVMAQLRFEVDDMFSDSFAENIHLDAVTDTTMTEDMTETETNASQRMMDVGAL